MLPAQAAQPTPLADVPLSTMDSRLSVGVRFGTREAVECIIDTGSNFGIVNHKLSHGANSLGRPKVNLAGSKAIAMPMVEMRDVAIGRASLRIARFLVRDTWWVSKNAAMPCILGGSFLDRFTVDLDFVAKRLRLYERKTRIDSVIGAPAANEYDLHARVSSGRIVFDAVIDGTTTPAFIDTGWIMSSGNGALLNALGVAADDSRIRVNRRVLPSGKDFTTRLLDLGPIQLGHTTVPLHSVDFGYSAAWSAERKWGPLLHIGTELLADFRLIIDAAHRQVVLMPGTPGD
jgi:hypothetical protein